MEHNFNVNSSDYWDQRFAVDWEINDGPLQSRFFAKLAAEYLPEWLFEEIRRQGLTLADWGCAQGDGTNFLTNFIKPNQLFGIDFSNSAIETARKRYPGIGFFCENWLDADNGSIDSYDVVFSSNTLEHFHDPYEVLDALSLRAKNALILVLPYREIDRIKEHFYSFLPDNIPIYLKNGFHLVWSKVVDCSGIKDNQWPGEQIFLVYVNPIWCGALKLGLASCSVEKDDVLDRGAQIVDLQRSLGDRDAQVVDLQRSLGDRDAQVVDLQRSLGDRDVQVVDLQRSLGDRDAKILDLKNSLNDKDVHIANLNERLEGRDSKILELYKSRSWKVTAPMRFAKDFVRAPLKTSYRTLRVVFWKLPPSVRQALHGPRHRFVRMVRSLPASNVRMAQKYKKTDLSWGEFNEHILEKGNYNGIFIQELVIDWNVPLYQRPQHISVALGRLDFLVIYKTINWTNDDVNGFRQVEKNVWVTNRYEVDRIEGAVRSIYSTAYTNTPELISDLNGGVLIYEYIDHIDPKISGDEGNIKRLLAMKDFAFSGGADYIVASSKQLYAEAVEKVGAEKVLLIPNGVDTAHYRNPVHELTTLPESLIRFKNKYKTIVGYFGALAPWLWYEMISELVSIRRDLGFVFIGPDYYGGAKKLPVVDNVLYMGAVDYKVLPAYAKSFDVCFIPFESGDIAKTTSPLKLFEYFALEKPVVVTADMAECTQYPEVLSGGTVAEINMALDKAIKLTNDGAFKRRLAEMADENNWMQRAQLMLTCFERLK